MKILQVIPSLNAIGGAEKFVMELSVALHQTGQDITILSLYSKENDFFDNFIETNNLKVVYLNKKRGVDFKTSAQLIKEIKKINPDIIHGHLNFHLTLMLSGRYKIRDIPFVETLHQDFSNPDKNRMLKKYISRLYKSKTFVPVAISDEVKRTAVKYFNISKEIPVIYNGIKLPDLSSNQPINTRKNEFITVSRLDPIKNHYLMIEAVSNLVNKGYNPKLTIIGNGGIFFELNRKIKEKLMENNIFLIGEKKNVFDYLITHKFFLLPSFSEGNPLSLLEAMSCGLIPIVTNIGGPKDIVSAEHGYLVDPYEVNTLVSAMEDVINNPQKNESYSKTNFEKSKKYNIYNTAKEYLVLFNKLLVSNFKNRILIDK